MNTTKMLLATLALGLTASLSQAGPPMGFYPIPSAQGHRPGQNFIGYPGNPGFPGGPVSRPSFYPSRGPIAPTGHHHEHFEVRYRTCDHEPWRCAGHFDCRHDANRAAHRLQRRGYEVIVICSH
jgi:hypothetical protein